MKPNILALLALSLLIASCRPATVQRAANVCKTSCDDVITQLARASNSLDDALRAGASQADDAGRLFSVTDDYLDDLSRAVTREVAVGEAVPYQLADDILRSSNQSSSHLERLVAWAERNEQGIDFLGEIVCDYRDEIMQFWMNQGGLTAGQLDKRWRELENGLEQNQIDPWDSSINLYCVILEIKSLP